MPAKCHHVQLNRSQRDSLKALITSGTSPARKLTRARVLLKAVLIGDCSDRLLHFWVGGFTMRFENA